ncbi:uncharacterized protein LOC105433278 [Pogonomyrmex barbatus]|uniref:Uncharacterized protein LOC105433278 n=1 Tax=Pogonomyrmex barbatus TaxID=144034 RepID=A0A6I9WVX6_9HYME|nr:uncharacterized protein LOC105433278 [Pogonomyrmex barbatus]
MRITVALSILAALCTIEAIPIRDLEILWMQVREKKWQVDTVIRQLEILYSETVEDTVEKISSQIDEEQSSCISYENSLITRIRKEVNAVGNNAKSCLDTAQRQIRTSAKNAFAESEICEKQARNSIENNLGFLDILIATGRELMSELDDIPLNCHDSNIDMRRYCIIAELARISDEIRNLERDSISAEMTTLPVSKNVIMRYTQCVRDAYSSVYTMGRMIILRAEKCIANANTPTTPSPTTTSSTTPCSTTASSTTASSTTASSTTASSTTASSTMASSTT